MVTWLHGYMVKQREGDGLNMKIKNYHRPRQITVLAQTTIELFPVVTCSRKNCQEGYLSVQPTLIVDGDCRSYMHHLGGECVDCIHLYEFWHLRLQALA